MAILSNPVTAGDDILASQYNNLRIDLLTGDITIAGVKTFSNTTIFNDVATFDVKPICTLGITLNDDSIIVATKKLYLGTSYIVEASSNEMDFFTGGTARFSLSNTRIRMRRDVYLDATKKFFWDVATNTYTIASSANVVDHVVGGAIKMRMDINGIAPGDNESMMWDVVIISLAGATPDSVGYIVDETKIYGISTIGHPSSTEAYENNDISHTKGTRSNIDNNLLNIHYGTGYGSGDDAQVIIFYIA